MLKLLQKEFGRLAGVRDNYSCLDNGAHNTALATYIGLECKILYVNTPKGPHAYLTDRVHAWSKNLTWKDDSFPELKLNQIASMGGRDVTKELFMQAFGIGSDLYNHHVVIDNLSKELPEIIYFLKQIYQID